MPIIETSMTTATEYSNPIKIKPYDVSGQMIIRMEIKENIPQIDRYGSYLGGF